MKKILDMLNKQEELNCLTNGDDWKSNLTDRNKVINWLRCIRREAMELADSYPWEHWKAIDREPDIDNALIELTDLWFFIMSYILSKVDANESIANRLYEMLSDRILVVDTDIPDLADQLIKATFDNNIGNDQTYLIYRFNKCMKALDVDINFLYKLYNGKLMLNKFRQDNGYKEGTYKKLWDKKEDNVHMLDILRTNKDIDNDVLYKALDSKHKSLVGKDK